MKNLILSCVVFSLTFALFAAERISDVVVTQPDRGKTVTVSYGLAADAVVTAEFSTNGVPLAQGLHLEGDVNRYVEADGSRKSFVWKMRKDTQGWEGAVTVKLTSTLPGLMPDYLVIDLLSGDRRFYARAEDLPNGVSDMVYKTDKLVLRRVHAAAREWRMGQPTTGEQCMDGNNTESQVKAIDSETAHTVALTDDFYISIYEVTQRQYYHVTGTNPSSNKGGGTASDNYEATKAFPVENMSYEDLRGTTDSDFSGWPQDVHAVAEGSVIDTFRHKLGIQSLDLPTEAQWEYACRAGTRTTYNNGVDSRPLDTALEPLAWYNKPGGLQVTHEVGTKLPNCWGLYDMHGNVFEWCLDWYSTGADWRATFASDWQQGGVTVDPVGPSSGTYRVVRGGDYFYSAYYARSASRPNLFLTPDLKSQHQGLRLVCSGTLE